ncbi:hypothetical protein U9M48_014321 [Paspalum notatum var. saurae]|uniref:Uncharacterized protein n=1 Tax=Paspalum notatum var. saurae TaxID=547442 RepID=A0AAQ3T1C4_PASNO
MLPFLAIATPIYTEEHPSRATLLLASYLCHVHHTAVAAACCRDRHGRDERRYVQFISSLLPNHGLAPS